MQDYAVLHQSCIYGPNQQGTEDQGWVSHLMRSKLAGRPVTCFGDGTQVRDLLHVQDLVELYSKLMEAPYLTIREGPVGGGCRNALSFREVAELIGVKVREEKGPWRPHDQRYFTASNEEWVDAWEPKVDFREWITQWRAQTELRSVVEEGV